MNKVLGLAIALLSLCFMYSCTDEALIDTNVEIPNRSWSYNNRVRIPVKINDAGKSYSIYLNLRHTSEYKYSNIFLLISQSGPGMKKTTERREFKLSYPDGEWLGSGSGNFYTYLFPLRKGYKFPSPGTYVFEFEQNMRDNPLPNISSIGIRVVPDN